MDKLNIEHLNKRLNKEGIKTDFTDFHIYIKNTSIEIAQLIFIDKFEITWSTKNFGTGKAKRRTQKDTIKLIKDLINNKKIELVY